VVQTFFDCSLFQKTCFCDNKCDVFGSKIALWRKMKNEKGHNPKMLAALFLNSAYFSDAKTTFGMFGMICFGVDSQTHTLWCVCV
jgi:hypothetical protein